ncbi:VOC family protein [Camelliibacillus cellulosilyticus]|uniref:VOC family protein n=1 Tax=Camelliibacillus cellulosilyticus TaxID=2174486 RepID=A0ABV9GP30_9BACL
MAAQVAPYLMLEGKTREAIDFYKNVMNAKVVTVTTYGEMEMPCPGSYQDHIAYALLKIGDTDLMFSDSPDIPVKTGNQVQITISTKDANEARQIFEALKQDGRVNAELEETPFSPAFGNVTDKFGVTFQIVALYEG